jgi:hypothetical protein
MVSRDRSVQGNGMDLGLSVERHWDQRVLCLFIADCGFGAAV